MLSNIGIDLLRSFVTVVDQGSIARAAAALGRTQPAISLQMQRLELLVDTLLFRRRRPLALTEDGQALLGYARRILHLNDEAVARFRKERRRQILRVGIPNDFAAALLPEALRRFADDNPDVLLEVRSELSYGLLAALTGGEFDLAVAMSTDRPREPAVKSWRDELTWVSGRRPGMQASAPTPIVAYPQGCIYRARMIERLASGERGWRIALTSPSHSSLIAAVKAGLGVSAFAASTAPPELAVKAQALKLPALGQVTLGIYQHPDGVGEAGGRLTDYLVGAFEAAMGRGARSGSADQPARRREKSRRTS